MKIAVDFGHGVNFDGGAVGILNEEKVVREYGPLVISQLQTLGHEVLNVTPSSATSLNNSLAQRVNVANNWGADLFVCCHANSFSIASANGCEVEYVSNRGKVYADKVVNEIAKLGFYDRGSVFRNDLYVLNRTNMAAILIEPFFVTNITDCNRYNANEMAMAIVEGLTGSNVQMPSPISQPTIPAPQPIVDQNILAVQRALNRLGYLGKNGLRLSEDGDKGPNTLYAIKSFQADMGLSVDGDPGPNTWGAINQILSKPEDNVPAPHFEFATRYICRRVGCPIGGYFDNRVRQFVIAWQSKNGLSADGTIGPISWRKLIG